MRILHVARTKYADFHDRWAKFGIQADFLSDDQLLDVVTDPISRSSFIPDALVVVTGTSTIDQPSATNTFGPAAGVILSLEVRKLPDGVAMPDGRKWKALPILVFAPSETDLAEAAGAAAAAKRYSRHDIETYSMFLSDDFGGAQIKDAIRRYRQNVLDELDDLGFVVSYDAGRYRVKPALTPRDQLVGHYYFGPADSRPNHFVTIDRDLLGIQLEVEQFESLVNRSSVTETELQHFFEEHPYFLSTLVNPLPHVRLQDSVGKLLIPDFILKPIVAVQRDSRWEVLDLKKPQARLLSGKGTRKRLSQEVMAAIAQLREYGAYFADTRNSQHVEATLGHRLRNPKLGVLIGRMSGAGFEELDNAQRHVTDVRLVTYDEILGEQKALLS